MDGFLQTLQGGRPVLGKTAHTASYFMAVHLTFVRLSDQHFGGQFDVHLEFEGYTRRKAAHSAAQLSLLVSD